MSSTAVIEFRSAEFLRDLVKRNRNKPAASAPVDVRPEDVPPYMPDSAFVLGDEIIECEVMP